MNELISMGGQQVAAFAETSATAAASQAKALVEARYVMAIRRPRNWEQVRQDLMKECRRPAFAHNKSAFYKKPVGKGFVDGLGIRFVELALRCMTNITVDVVMVFEDETKEIHRVTVTDLESNFPLSQDVKVSKTVERSKPSDDGSYVSVRKNSYGKDVFTVPANDDDLLNKRGALISKVMRTLGLRLIPGDLQDEAESTILKVRTDAAAQDPEAEAKRVVDAFASLRVDAEDLAAYLGHPVSKCSPAQLVDLRGLYGAIRDGETTWRAVMENKAEQDGEPVPEKKAEPQSGPRRKSDGKPKEEPAVAAAETPHPDAQPVKVSAGQVKYLEGKLASVGIEPATICTRFSASSLADLDVEQFDIVRAEIIVMS